MTKKQKVIGIVKDDAITGVSYGLVDVQTLSQKIMPKEKTNTLSAAYLAANKTKHSLLTARLRSKNTKHK